MGEETIPPPTNETIDASQRLCHAEDPSATTASGMLHWGHAGHRMRELFGRDEHSPQTGDVQVQLAQKMQDTNNHLLRVILLEFTLTGSTATTKQMVYVTHACSWVEKPARTWASFQLSSQTPRWGAITGISLSQQHKLAPQVRVRKCRCPTRPSARSHFQSPTRKQTETSWSNIWEQYSRHQPSNTCTHQTLPMMHPCGWTLTHRLCPSHRTKLLQYLCTGRRLSKSTWIAMSGHRGRRSRSCRGVGEVSPLRAGVHRPLRRRGPQASGQDLRRQSAVRHHQFAIWSRKPSCTPSRYLHPGYAQLHIRRPLEVPHWNAQSTRAAWRRRMWPPLWGVAKWWVLEYRAQGADQVLLNCFVWLVNGYSGHQGRGYAKWRCWYHVGHGHPLLTAIEGFPDKQADVLTSIRMYRSSLYLVDGVAVYKERVIIPASLRGDCLQYLHSAYQGTTMKEMAATWCVPCFHDNYIDSIHFKFSATCIF